MEIIIPTKVINTFDPIAIRDTMVEAANGIYDEERDYFANIPVNRRVSDISLDQLLAESYIDAPVCRYGGHVLIQDSDQIKRYGAGEIRNIVLSPDARILAIQPYLPRISGITERGSLIHEGKPGFGTGKLRIGPKGYSIHSNMSLFVQATGKFKGMYKEDTVHQ